MAFTLLSATAPMPSSPVLRRLLLTSALASIGTVGPAAAQLLPTDPTTSTSTTAPPTPPTTARAPTTTAAAATTAPAPTTTKAPTTTRTGGGTATTATVASTTTVDASTTTALAPDPTPPGDGDVVADTRQPSLPPLARVDGTRINWAALISLAGFAVALGILALPAIAQRVQKGRRPVGPTTRR